MQPDQVGKDQSCVLRRTYKQIFGGIGKGGLFGRVFEVGRHVNELCLLIELCLEIDDEGIARHGAAAGTGRRPESGRVEGRRGIAVAKGVVGGEFEV